MSCSMRTASSSPRRKNTAYSDTYAIYDGATLNDSKPRIAARKTSIATHVSFTFRPQALILGGFMAETRDQTTLARLISEAYRVGKYDEAVALEKELASLTEFTL